MRGGGVAKARRKAGCACRRHSGDGDRPEAQRDKTGPRPRRPVAPEDCAQKPRREHELPSERIEKPAAGLGPARRVEAERARTGVDQDRGDEGERGVAHRDRDRQRRPQHQHDIERQNVEVAELMAEQGDAGEPGRRRAEDERSAMGFDQILNAAHPVGDGENDKGGRSQRDVHAVKLQRALKASTRDRRKTMFAGSWQIDHPDREAREEHEGLRTVRKPEVPRREKFEHVARNVIDQDRDQHSAAPKIDAADTLCVRHRAPVFKNRASPVPTMSINKTVDVLKLFRASVADAVSPVTAAE